MLHQMHAEYGDEGPAGPVKRWHMVPGGTHVGLCGRELAEGAALIDSTEWGRTTEPCCRSCGVTWFQSVPYLADEHPREDFIP